MVRILIVDDLEQWRQQIREYLKGDLNLQVIGEASSGLAAVQLAAELLPHVVLLDIGLPDLNGVQVAERIGNVSPASKVIFVTQNHNFDLANALVRNRAHGYVLKAKLHSELSEAIAQVLAGGRFVSQEL